MSDVPLVDRTKLCTTDGRSVDEARAAQSNETGQHPSYIVLCEEERQKGFVRPFRDSYKHVGRQIERCEAVRQDATDENPHQCALPYSHEGDCRFDVLMILNGPIRFMPGRHGGCGSVTTMGRALSETYARDPKFYGATFCVTCNRHLPVDEFVWTADGQVVGS